MIDNVRLSHTAHGAETSISYDGLQIVKKYPTMQAAAKQAVELSLISRHQELSISPRGMALPLGVSTTAEHINYDKLFDIGFEVDLRCL